MCKHIDPDDGSDAPSPYCGMCKDGPTITRATKRKVKELPTVDSLVDGDPVRLKLGRIAAGLWCLECDTPVDHHGHCQHVREELFLADTAEIENWFAEQGESRTAGFTAQSALRRAHLKLGQDMPSAVPGTSFAQLDASAARKRFLGERKAFGFRRPSVSEPSELPI